MALPKFYDEAHAPKKVHEALRTMLERQLKKVGTLAGAAVGNIEELDTAEELTPAEQAKQEAIMEAEQEVARLTAEGIPAMVEGMKAVILGQKQLQEKQKTYSCQTYSFNTLLMNSHLCF